MTCITRLSAVAWLDSLCIRLPLLLIRPDVKSSRLWSSAIFTHSHLKSVPTTMTLTPISSIHVVSAGLCAPTHILLCYWMTLYGQRI